MWLTIRAYLVSIVLPIAIDILSNIAANIGPQVKGWLNDTFQDQYDKAVVSGDTVWQTIIVNIIAVIFGLTIVVAPDVADVPAPGDLVQLYKKMAVKAADKVRAKYDAEDIGTPETDPHEGEGN